ncbi:MAG: hypothetical protein ACTSPM_05575 [Candidatus Heimdallarchaeota archaeon]
MSAQEVIESTEPKMFANWREYPLEVKIMDISTLAWLAIFIIEIIFLVANVEANIRVFPMVMLPILMFIVTFSLRLKLVDKPATIKTIFAVWLAIFLLATIGAILVLALYPELMPSIA